MLRTAMGVGLLLASWAPSAFGVQGDGGLPVSGKPVPELAAFDAAMLNHMNQYGVEAGILGVMKDSEVVYLRGFGYLSPGIAGLGIPGTPLSEMAMMRLASCEKPLTAAAIHKLAAAGALDLEDNVFDLGQWNGGLLNIAPAGTLATEYLKIVTVQDLLDHEGGWDRDLIGYDPMFDAVNIAAFFGVPSPPTRQQIASFMLTQPLQHIPGTTFAYSNFGYMLLGLIVEQQSGMSHQAYIQQAVFEDEDWVPSTELVRGRSYKLFQSPREPWYRSPYMAVNVFDPNGSLVSSPYGGWHQESMVGHGNMVASAAPLLHFLDRYVTIGGSIGLPKGAGLWSASHNGVLDGTNTVMQQRDSDGVHVVVLFNERNDQPHLASSLAAQIYQIVDNQITSWPTSRRLTASG